jgi:hypothetical protein
VCGGGGRECIKCFRPHQTVAGGGGCEQHDPSSQTNTVTGSIRRSSSESERGTSKVSRSLYRELAAVCRRIEDMEQQFILRTGYRPSQVSMAHREKNLKMSAKICHYFMALL